MANSVLFRSRPAPEHREVVHKDIAALGHEDIEHLYTNSYPCQPSFLCEAFVIYSATTPIAMLSLVQSLRASARIAIAFVMSSSTDA